jgi:hypothetical protein
MRIASALISLSLVGCAQSTAPTGSIAVAEQAVTGGQPVLDGASNTQSTESGAISKNDLSKWLGIETAEASVGCGYFAAGDTCSTAGTKTATYYGCQSWGGTILGTVTLSYSNNICLLDAASGTVTRKVLLTREGLPAGTMYTNSASTSTTYSGSTAGAGTQLSFVSVGSYNLNVLGVRKTLNDTSGNTIYDLIAQTNGPIAVTGNLLGTRVLNGGSLIVVHNTAQYTATFTPNYLTYSDPTCCHPVSGSLSVTYAGNVSGTAVVTFNPTCGSETFSMNGENDTIQLAGCE